MIKEIVKNIPNSPELGVRYAINEAARLTEETGREHFVERVTEGHRCYDGIYSPIYSFDIVTVQKEV